MGNNCAVITDYFCLPKQSSLNDSQSVGSYLTAKEWVWKQGADQIATKYYFMANQQNGCFGRCFRVGNRITQQQYLLKEYEWQEDAFKQIQKLKTKRRTFSSHRQLIQIIDLQLIQYPTLDNIFLVLEIPPETLKDTFCRRIRAGQTYSRNEIADILVGTVRGYACLEECGCRNDKVRMETIFYEEGTYWPKVVDNSLIKSSTNYKVLQKQGYFSRDSETVYLSPEEFIGYLHFKDEPVTNEKSGVFALGVSILALCLMMPVNCIYNTEQKIMNTAMLKSFIKTAGNTHGKFVQNMLQLMLQLDQLKRPNFGSLQAVVQRSPRVSLKQVYESKRNKVSNPTQTSIQFKQDANQIEGIKSKKYKRHQRSKTANFNEFNQSNLSSQNCSIGTQKSNFTNLNSLSYKNRSNLYQGQLRRGQPHGWGVLHYNIQNSKVSVDDDIFSNGSISSINCIQLQKYQGNFLNGQLWGVGRLYYSDGTIIQGQFINGKLIKKTKDYYLQTQARRWSLVEPTSIFSANYNSFPTEFQLNP